VIEVSGLAGDLDTILNRIITLPLAHELPV
jgi:hypothetical protein